MILYAIKEKQVIQGNNTDVYIIGTTGYFYKNMTYESGWFGLPNFSIGGDKYAENLGSYTTVEDPLARALLRQVKRHFNNNSECRLLKLDVIAHTVESL